MLAQRAVQEIHQFCEPPLRVLGVIHRTPGDHPSVQAALVCLAFVPAAPIAQCRFEPLDCLRGHAPIVARVAEVQAGLDRGQDKVRTSVSVRCQVAAVKRCGGGDPVRPAAATRSAN